MSERIPNRFGQYKHSTPPWKEVYRERCLHRVREGRSRLVDRFRGVQDSEEAAMEQEWDRLEQKRSNEELDAMLHVMEEMQNEKRLEEQQMLRQYEERLQFEEDRFSACIECFLADDVICPICKRNPLQQDKQVIFCFCGMRVDTKNHAVTLDFVKNQLKDAMEQHGKMNECCFGEALFSVSSYPEYDISNLIMACTGCDFLAVVL